MLSVISRGRRNWSRVQPSDAHPATVVLLRATRSASRPSLAATNVATNVDRSNPALSASPLVVGSVESLGLPASPDPASSESLGLRLTGRTRPKVHPWCRSASRASCSLLSRRRHLRTGTWPTRGSCLRPARATRSAQCFGLALRRHAYCTRGRPKRRRCQASFDRSAVGGTVWATAGEVGRAAGASRSGH